MKTIRLLTPILLLILLTAATAWSSGKSAYNYIPGDELETRLRAEEKLFLLDIQVEEEFGKHHIKGAFPTYAYPAKSESDKAKLVAAVERIKASAEPVVIVCPGGGGGATRTVDYLVAQGVDPRRLLILEKGQSAWKCADLTEGK